MKKEYEDLVVKASTRLMIYFGCFSITLCLLLETITMQRFDELFLFILAIFLGDSILTYLSYKSLKIQLKYIE